LDGSIRNVTLDDYPRIVAVADDWWEGRPISRILHPIFVVHFGDTGFVAEREGDLVAFLLGFMSQRMPSTAHIHIVGVRPDARRSGVARALYERFFKAAGRKGCNMVTAITSPVNAGSIAFHRRMGFDLVSEGVDVIDGVPVHRDYAGPGQDRVLFERRI